jgi:hypothetical protein
VAAISLSFTLFIPLKARRISAAEATWFLVSSKALEASDETATVALETRLQADMAASLELRNDTSAKAAQ